MLITFFINIVFGFYILLHPNSTYYRDWLFMCRGVNDGSLVITTSVVMKLIGRFDKLWRLAPEN